MADVIGIVKYRRSNLWTAGKISLNTSLLSMASHIVGIEYLIAIHGITYCVYWTPHCYPWHHILWVLNTSLLSMASHIVCIEHLIAIHDITYCVYWTPHYYPWYHIVCIEVTLLTSGEACLIISWRSGSCVFNSDINHLWSMTLQFFSIHFGNPPYLLPWLVLAPLIQQMEYLWFEIDVGVHQIIGHKLHSTFFSNILSLKKNGEVHFQCRVAEDAFYF